MEEKKKSINWWKIIFISLLIVFMCLYFMNMVGYYDASRNRMLLTEEKRRQFEEDVSEGKEIDIKDYFEDQNKDYSNNFSNVSLKISDGVDMIVNKGLRGTMKALGKLLK